MRVNSRAIAAASLTALALLATSCSGGGTAGGSPSAAAPTVKEGGQITMRGCTPENPLIGSNTAEVCGGDIVDAIAARLVRYDAKTAAPVNDLAEEIKTSDNKTFTVTLKKGVKFTDGTEVKAKNFVDTWNFAAYAPYGQANSYFLAPFEGYGDLQCGDDGDCEKNKPKSKEMSGLKVVDDYSFTITTTEPVSNLPVRLGYSGFSAQPDAFLALLNPDDAKGTGEKIAEWAKSPIGSGPFKVTANTATEIVLAKNADYNGPFKAKVDQITYRIYNDTNAAYTDVQADNLDFMAGVPTDYLAGDTWKKDFPDRNVQIPTGVIQWITLSPKDEQLKGNDKLRQALSLAIDRDTITKTIFNGSRVPASGWVSPSVDGYKAGQCSNCVYDKAKAQALYKESGGYKGAFTLSVNGDGGHKPWADAVCNSLKNDLGLNCVVNITPDFKTLRKQIKAGELKGAFRGGWQMDYPSIENFLAPIYGTGADSNDAKYSNPAFDAKLKEAAAATDAATANKLYQEAEAMLNEGIPTIPLWYGATSAVWSTKVTNVQVTAFGTLDMSSITVK